MDSRLQGTEWSKRAYPQGKLNIWAMPLPHFCLKLVCKKFGGGGAYFQENTVVLLAQLIGVIASLICGDFVH